MFRKTASGLILAILAVGMVLLVFNIQPAIAQGSIYIRADGSIDPPTSPVSTSDNVTYNLTGNIISHVDGIIVERDNITIDGHGYSIQGFGWIPSGYWTYWNGILLSTVSNVTIANTVITRFHTGIYLNNSSQNNVSSNNILANLDAIYCDSSNHNNISGNQITNNAGDGIYLYNSSSSNVSNNRIAATSFDGIVVNFLSDNNTLTDNEVTGSGWNGISLYSTGNVLSRNTFSNNSGNFGVGGYTEDLSTFLSNSIDTSNLVEGKPVYYLTNQLNIIVSPETYPDGIGFLGLVNCVNVTVRGFDFMNNVEGLLLANTSESLITGNNFTANTIDGLYICHSSGNSVSDDNFTYNSTAGQIGVRLYNCSGNTLSRNNFKISKGSSIELDSSSDNILSGNSMTCPILIAYSSMRNVVSSNDIGTDGHGWITLYHASNNTLIGNNVTDTEYGGINILDSSGNVVTENNVVAAEDAVYLSRSINNTIYHNNFGSNETEAICEDSTSIWDNGSEGNYWSDYSGTDVYSGQYQNLTGSDGIGDTPNVIDSNNSDNHPLMKPYPWDSHDLGVTYVGEVSELGIVPLKTVLGLGSVLNVSVFVMNYGRYPEVFNAAVYANTTVIGAVANVALTNRNSVILNFTCDTTGLPYGNYTISAYATPVPSETDTTDNNRTGGTVYIGLIPGDLNGDDIVDIYDALTAARAFGSTPSSPHWNQAADLNRDSQVDIFDIIILAQNFGKALHA